MLSIRASRLTIKALPLSTPTKALPIRHLSSSVPRNSTPPPEPPITKPEGFKEYGKKEPPPPPLKAQYSEFNAFPFLLILFVGTLGFSQLVKSREGTAPPAQTSSRSSFN